MRHIFIINPHAGKKDSTAAIYAMADRLRDEHGQEVVCMLTDRPGGAADMLALGYLLDAWRMLSRDLWEVRV